MRERGGQAHLEQARPTQRDRWPVALVLFPLWFSNSPCRLCVRPTSTQTFFSRSKRWLLSLARRGRERGYLCVKNGQGIGKERRGDEGGGGGLL